MKTFLFFTFLSCCLITACNNKPTEQTNATPPEAASNTNSSGKEATCYRFYGERDTFFMQLSEVYGTMTGMLVYKNSNKDNITGTMMGNMTGDVLIADLTYTSEGVKTIRQVAFKRKEKDLIEGFGEMTIVNDKKIFADLKTLRFEEKRLFANVPCKR